MERTYTVEVLIHGHDVQLMLRDEFGVREYTMTMQQARALATTLDVAIQQIVKEHGATLPIVAVSCVSGNH